MGRKKASANSKAMAFRTRELNIAPHTTTKNARDYTHLADFPSSHEPQLCGIDGATPGNYESSGSGFLVCPGNQEP
jgi:hypothetical protein